MIMVTGAAGFIGTNLIHYLIRKKKSVIAVDNLSIPTGNKNIHSIKSTNFIFVKGSIENKVFLNEILKKYKPTMVINLAAETHVDKSIVSPKKFIHTNIYGVFTLLEAVREYYDNLKKIKKNQFRFLQVSTDEVYGSLKKNEKSFDENNKYIPNSPYSASKAAGDHLVNAWYKTYGVPTLITNCSNNYGPYQYFEKLIPLTILNSINKQNIPVYGKGNQIRDWLYVEDHCAAIFKVLNKGKIGNIYNIGGNEEKTNLDVIKSICSYLDQIMPREDKKKYSQQIKFIEDRPGHDFRYSINYSKINKELNWRPKYNFDVGITHTVNWYLNNLRWLKLSNNNKFKNWYKNYYKLTY